MFRNLLLLVGALLLRTTQADPVHIISFNLEQTVTSSTLQWVPMSSHNTDYLKNAVIAGYQIIESASNEPTAMEGTNNDVINQSPVYICRAKVNGIWVTGQLRSKTHLCVASLYKEVQEYSNFEVLINIDQSGRLSWVSKNKYTNIPQGAVTSGENVLRTFVARKPVNKDNQYDGALTHYIGNFNPSENLGVYHLVDENNREIADEDGEMLVETEPIEYEFKQIKFKRTGRRFPKKRHILAQTVLKNDENGLQKVESVMTYNYEYFLSWGKGHGLLTGLPYTVYLPTGEKVSGMWALAKPENKIETYPVEKYLEEGTAVNAQITIVNITSLLSIKPFSSFTQYSVGKAAREAYFRAFATEHPQCRVLSYSPGPVDTDMHNEVCEKTYDDNVKKLFSKRHEGSTINRKLLTVGDTVTKFLGILEKNKFESGDRVDYFDDE